MSRFPWLLCNVAGGLLAALLSYAFEPLLDKVVAIALFMPVVLGLSESVAIQSMTLALLEPIREVISTQFRYST